MGEKGNIIDLDKYRIIHNLREKGYQWLEDGNGKVRVWMRTEQNMANTKLKGFLKKQ